MSESQPNNFNTKISWNLVLIAGLVAGTMDITAACTQAYLSAGISPERVLKYVASGVFGMDAIKGDGLMAFFGLLFHYVIATSWAALFYLMYPMLSRLIRNWIILGISYGAFVWVMMNLIVVPLSNVPRGPITLQGAIVGMIILMVCIGTPISYLVKRNYLKSS